jgi:hypothetical protein
MWGALDITHDGAGVLDPWSCKYPLLILLRRIWNSRNDMVFRLEDVGVDVTLRAIVRDLDLRSHRYRWCVNKQRLLQWRGHATEAIVRRFAASPSS